jgi:large-conductance mechanosensitive channel
VAETLLSLATGLGLSTAAGFNAYLPLLITGIVARTTDLITLDAPFDRLEEPVVLGAIAAIGVIDFVGDKVPPVDHVLHGVGLVVAPVAGAVLALSATSDTDVMPAVALIIGVLAAEATQGARASVRPLSTVTTGGIGNPVLSLGEDGLSATLSFAAIIVPLVALVLVAAIVVLLVLAVRRARRRRPSSTAPLVRP